MSGMRTTALLLLLIAGSGPIVTTRALAQPAIIVTANIAPPPLPVYLQPAIPGPGYLWSPGYWDWDSGFGYFWVPGTWVLPPRPALLWTPAYWGWSGSVYVFHAGYWGPSVGFYGGVVYGFGYTGTGFQGGYWNNGSFFYNRSVTNITNVNVTNVYNQTVVTNITNVSYNGGAGGTAARPTPQQIALAQQPHEPATPAQTQQAGVARTNPVLRQSANHGVPPIAATPRPSVFTGAGVMSAVPGGRVAPTAPAGIQRPAAATPANTLPTGNALPAGRPLQPSVNALPHAPGAQPLRAGVSGSQTPARLAPQSTPPSASPSGRPDAASVARQRDAIAQQRNMMQQQRVDQMVRQQAEHQQTARQQAARQQQLQPRRSVMAQRPAQTPHFSASHFSAPRMARPAPQRFAARAAPRRGRH